MIKEAHPHCTLPGLVVGSLLEHLDEDALERGGEPRRRELVLLEHVLEAAHDVPRRDPVRDEARDPEVGEERREARDGLRHRPSDREVLDYVETSEREALGEL